MTPGQLPYFDFLLSELAKQNPAVEKSFGRHVHWGYWENPRTASYDDDDYARAAEQLTRELCGLAEITEGYRVLDVGCGFGGTIASLNERFGRLRLSGLNIDARQLARARQQVLPLRENSVEFHEGDACALPFPDNSFDRVLAVECVFHFPSREVFFREAGRVLRPGGVLVLSDFVPSGLFRPLCGSGTSSGSRKLNAFGSTNMQYTIGRYRRLAAQTGFVSGMERNITRHTLPTYRYLQLMLARSAVSGRAGTVGRALGLVRLLGVSGLLKYYLLAFGKPS